MQRSPYPSAASFAFLGWALAATAGAQVSFSIDNQGPTIGAPDAFGGAPITHGDLLTPGPPGPFGPNPPLFAAPKPPGVTITGGALGIGTYPGCVGMPPGSFCPVELDAFSYGTDFPVRQQHGLPDTYWFSVDEWAAGMPAPAPPSVFTEGPAGPAFEAAGDVFADLGGFFAPAPPFAGPPGNTGKIDGDGFVSASGFVYPGLGIFEAIPPAPAPVAQGDNLDAVDTDSVSNAGPWYFSLDASFPDPLTGLPNLGSALVNGFVGGDVLVTVAAGGPPAVYAPALALGLDVFGVDTDDLDALALWENGTPGFQPATMPYAWLGGPVGAPSDMLLFSVRRGSAVIGMPDSLFGIPIEEGDILSTPIPTALGGISPFPSMWVAAENLALGTFRSGTNIGPAADELDALDVRCDSCGFVDCNGNGIPDSIDIATGTSTDVNGNGIPDECELIGAAYCFCTMAVAPCANDYATGGCRNGTGVGAILSASGTSSVINDDLLLTLTQATPTNFGLIFMGPAMIAPTPMGNGLRCVGGSLYRFLPVFVTDASGSATVGPMVGASASLPPAGNIVAVSTWNFQAWYRDPGGPCGANSNVSNAQSITFTP